MFKTGYVLAAVALSLLVQIAPSHAAIQERSVSIATSGSGSLSGTLYVPALAGEVAPAPGILLLHTAGGLKDADRNYARRLAEEGFAALVVSYQIGWAAATNEDLAKAVDWLRKQPECRDMPVGTVGFSLGASKALLVAALRPSSVKAVVAYYGTYNVDISKFSDVARRIREKTGAPTPSPVQVASQIGGAILLLQGENDDETPPEQTREMQAALSRAKKTYELKIYPGAVHMFEREPQFHPPGFRTSFGTVTGYQAEAAQDSWRKSVEWLKRHLRPTAG
ncbi:MAG: dienelactone hydrolase family protein [Candidatus Rokubacteria bacterium]|nr:dienelactone hydrolase family protein [Candidatus Rokubacteria bacterium]